MFEEVQKSWDGFMGTMSSAYQSGLAQANDAIASTAPYVAAAHAKSAAAVLWMEHNPLDTIAVGWFGLGMLLAIYFGWTHKYISPNASSALWSFVALGSWVLAIAFGMDLMGKTIFPAGNPPLVAMSIVSLIGMSFVTHRYAS